MKHQFKALLSAGIGLYCLLTIGCQKNTQWQNSTTPLLQKKEQLMQKINIIYQYNAITDSGSIKDITYYFYNGHTYTHIVFYSSNNQLQSIVIESYYTTTGEIQETTYRCDSNFCTCQIVIEQSENKDVTIRCSCTPCTMTIQ